MPTRELSMMRRIAGNIATDKLAAAREEKNTQDVSVELLPWAERIPEPKTGRLDWARYPFQVEMYRDGVSVREVVVKKATQIGVSAYLIRVTIYCADTKGWTSLYVFPTQDQVYDQSDARVKPLLEGEYLKSRVPRGYTQNKGLKQIGLGFVYFRGSQNKHALDSVDAA